MARSLAVIEAQFRVRCEATSLSGPGRCGWQVTARFGGQDVIGSATTGVQLTAFGMTPPRAGPVLSIQDDLGLQLDFHATRGSAVAA